MSNRSRLGLLAAAVIIAVVAFLALKPDEGSDEADNPVITGQDTEPSPPRPEGVVLRGGRPEGGVVRIEASKGQTVRFVVSSDLDDEIHLHGYDITRTAAPGRPARFRFRADVEGVFEIESHTAEDAGREPAIARLAVEP